MPPRFAFFGTPPFAATVLTGLLERDWSPVLVITESAKPTGRGLSTQPSAVQVLAEQRGLRVATPARSTELVELLQPLELDVAVVVAYGKILPPNLLAIPDRGFINVHASLLPKYRGASPVQAAIRNGDTETGVSFMTLEPTLDTGPVIEMISTPLTGRETTPELMSTLASLAAEHITPVLERWLDGASPVPQDDAHATYAPKLTKEAGRVELATIDPQQLDRMVRAFMPWPGVYTDEFGPRLLLRSGRLDDKRYVITSLQWEGKKPVDGQTFARGYPDILTKLPHQVTLGAN